MKYSCRHLVRFFSIALLCASCFSAVSFAQDIYTPLEKVISGTGFVPSLPANDTIHPGGLAILCHGQRAYTFLQSPQGAQVPETAPAHFAFPAADASSHFSLSVMLSAVKYLFSGAGINASVTADRNVKLGEIDADGLRLKYDAMGVLWDPEIQKQIKEYTAPGCSFWIVTEVATTQSITFTSAQDLSAAVSNLQQCVTPQPATNAGKPNGSPKAVVMTNSGSLCVQSNHGITMNSRVPLVFASRLISVQPPAVLNAQGGHFILGQVAPHPGYTLEGYRVQDILQVQYKGAYTPAANGGAPK